MADKENNQFIIRKAQPLYENEVDDSMTEKELINILIDNYTNLQRIKSASDKENEIEHQIQIVKVKLAIFGFVAEKLDIY